MKNKKTRQQGFIEGSAVLLAATAVVKILGALFKIPLNNILGELGAGYYTTAYDLYLPIFSLATAGVPVAVSRIISEDIANGEYRDAEITFKTAKKTAIITGIVGTLIFSLVSYPFVLLTCGGNLKMMLPVLSVIPCFGFSMVTAVYRGYFEGQRNMVPTAVSGIIEASGKLVFGLLLSLAVLSLRGDRTMKTLIYSASAALIGITLSTAVGMVYLIVKCKKNRDISNFQPLDLSVSEEREAFKKILVVALPVVLCSLLTNVTSLIDVMTVKNQLTRAISADKAYFLSKYSALIEKNILSDPNFTVADLPTALYGCHRSYAYSVYNLVPVLTSSFGIGLIPILSSAWAKGNKKEIKQNIETMIKTVSLLSMAAGMGILSLSKPILTLLYPDNTVAVAVAAKNLKILGVAAVFSGICVPMFNMLQAIGKQNIPLYNILIGAGLKFLLNYTLVSNPKVNIVGVPIGTAVCYMYVAISDFLCLIKYSDVRLNLKNTVLKPFVSAVACGVTAKVSYVLLGKIINSNSALTVISMLFAVAVFVLSVILLRTIDKNDVISFPQSEKIVKTLEKIRIIR